VNSYYALPEEGQRPKTNEVIWGLLPEKEQKVSLVFKWTAVAKA